MAQILTYFQLFSMVEVTKELRENYHAHTASVENSPHIHPGRVLNPGCRGEARALPFSQPCTHYGVERVKYVYYWVERVKLTTAPAVQSPSTSLLPAPSAAKSE